MRKRHRILDTTAKGDYKPKTSCQLPNRPRAPPSSSGAVLFPQTLPVDFNLGAPIGNTNARKENRLWSETLRRVVAQNDSERLRKAAEALVKQAEGGDVGALRELGDRLDGKAAQQLIHSGDEDAPIVQKIVRDVVKP